VEVGERTCNAPNPTAQKTTNRPTSAATPNPKWSFGRIMNLPNESDKQSLVDLLRRNRYLGFICSDFYRQKLYSPLAEHFLDINESGRCLIEGGGCPIPLSVWSIVLERVNQKLTQDDEDHKLCRRANVIYCLLHGPAFAARETLN
jgi:hypothetical protein